MSRAQGAGQKKHSESGYPQAATHSQEAPDSHQARMERKDRVLTQGTPALVDSIAEAAVTKEEDIFFICDKDGSVPSKGNHGLGLYYHDCRFLNVLERTLNGTRPVRLVASTRRGYAAVHELTNDDLRQDDGTLIKKETIGIKLERVIDSKCKCLHDLVTIQNFNRRDVKLNLELKFGAGFEDVFEIRGLLPEKKGRVLPPRQEKGVLFFDYDGGDGIYRSTSVHFFPEASELKPPNVGFDLEIPADGQKLLVISIAVAESAEQSPAGPRVHLKPDITEIEDSLHRSATEWLGQLTRVETDDELFDAVLGRSLSDLRVLHSRFDNEEYFAAGVPWFATLFGRDSLITSLQTLAFEPAIAEQTLKLLASKQGAKVDEWRDEQPGKILHELRVGELANLDEIPQTPYYGTIDATPLFLILMAEHASWTGSVDLFTELRENVERALEWMWHYGDIDGDGYLEYESKSKHGLVNQGWKDSGDAIVTSSGEIAKPPIALVEVQGYAYLARLKIAELYEAIGNGDMADRLRKEAADLKARFNKDFWLPDKKSLGMALDRSKKPLDVVGSNAGQALWGEIVEPHLAQEQVNQLMDSAMFTGWGIRTLANDEKAYNPLGYHLGTVWPHDNSLIAAGLKKYGFDRPVEAIFSGIIDLASQYPEYRLPELLCGFSKREYDVPVRYPVACHPQAWAAGSVPFLLQTTLGLVADARHGRLKVIRPSLPSWLNQVDLKGLRIGSANLNLRFYRKNGTINVETLAKDGKIEVEVQR